MIPFKTMDNSPLDNEFHVMLRCTVGLEYFPEVVTADDALDQIRHYRDCCKSKATVVDETLSRTLRGEDLRIYAVRIDGIVRQLNVLDQAITIADKGAPLLRIICVPAMAYLYGELDGLYYTVVEYHEQRSAA